MKASGLRTLGTIGVASIVLPLISRPAWAIEVGTAPDTPLGITLGLPVGAAPPPGLYINLHPTLSQGDGINSSGDRTGVSSNAFGDTISLTYVPGFTFLGATYSAALRGPGVLDVTVKTPGGTASGIGMDDWLFVPLNLSWALGNGFFFDFEFGFDAPTGGYDAANEVNIGANHWAIAPAIALTYLKDGYDLTAHVSTESGFVNPSTNYTNGTLMFVDLTATKKFGRWTTGPVAFSYNQLSPDSGPRALNAGYPTEIAAGWDLGYDLADGVGLNGWLARDVYAKNVSTLAVRAQINLTFQIF